MSEELSLFYMRTHFISYTKLYNRNLLLDRTSSLQGESTLIVNRSALILCKLHLRCLFRIAKNRSPLSTRNFLKLRIVDFLTTQIDLEYDVAIHCNW